MTIFVVYPCYYFEQCCGEPECAFYTREEAQNWIKNQAYKHLYEIAELIIQGDRKGEK